MRWRSLWMLFCQAVVLFAAAAFVFIGFTRFYQAPASYSGVVTQALPSVVSINGGSSDGAGSSIGSGVVISKRGYILTNYHLIANIDSIEVGLQNEATHIAEVIGVDPEIDIAVLRIQQAADLSAMTTAAETSLSVGDIVFAIGNPFGLKRSATMGIVSAVGRDRIGLHGFERFIQTDAAINPGSSGGALTDSRGNLVGINSALFYRQHGVPPQGIGFAIPAGIAMRSYRRLIDDRPADNRWGAEVRSMSPRLRSEILGERTESSLLVARVWPDSLAAKSGMKVGDIVLRLDGEEPEKQIRDGMLPDTAEQILVLRAGDEFLLTLSK